MKGVIRGPATAEIRGLHAGDSCQGIDVGEYGYVVRDVDMPEVAPDPRDLSVRGGRGYAHGALLAAGLPDTSSAPDVAPKSAAMPWTWVAMWLGAAFLLAHAFGSRPAEPSLRSHPRE